MKRAHTYTQKKAQTFSPPAAGDPAHAAPGLTGGRRGRHGHASPSLCCTCYKWSELLDDVYGKPRRLKG